MGAAPILTILRNGAVVRTHVLENESVVGRSENCAIRLDDRAISREHAVIRLHGDRVEVERKSQFAPLIINGAEMTSAILKEGDLVNMGPYQLKLQKGSAEQGQEVDPNVAFAKVIGTIGVPASSDAAVSPNLEGVSAQSGESDEKPLAGEDPTGSAYELGPPPAAVEFEAKNTGIEMAPEPESKEEFTLDQVNRIEGEPLQEAQVAPPEPDAEAGTATASPDPALDDVAIPDDLFGVPASTDQPEVLDTSAIHTDQAPVEEPASGSVIQEAPSSVSAQVTSEATNVVAKDERRVVLKFPYGGTSVPEFVILKDEISIGRDSICDVVLDDKKSSRKHALILKVGTGYALKDLGSSNGTRLNGNRIDQEMLTGDDRIRIGNVEFLFQILAPNQQDGQAGERTADKVEGLNTQDIPSIEGFAQEFGHNIPEQFSPDPHQGAPDMPAASGQDFGTPNLGAGDLGLAQPFGVSGVETQPNQKKSLFMDWLKKKSVRSQVIWVGAMIAFAYLLLVDDELTDMIFGPEPKPKAQVRKGAKNVAPKKDGTSQAQSPAQGPSWESLNADQKKFIQAQLDKASQKHAAKDYDGTLFELDKIFSLTPDYKNAREIERYAREGKRLAEIEKEETRKRIEAEKLKQQIAEMASKVGAAIDKKDFVAAKDLLPQLLNLDPENPQAATWKKDIDAYFAAEAEKQKQLEVKKLVNAQAWKEYQEALALKKQGKCLLAMPKFKAVAAISAEDRKPAELAKKQWSSCRTSLAKMRDPFLKEGHDLEQSGELAKAYKVYEKALKVDPASNEARTGMERTSQVLHDRARSAYTEGVLAESYSDFTTAIRKYEEILGTVPVSDRYYESAQRKLSKLKLGAGKNSGDAREPSSVTK